jgi:asparagine synthase (glutamine-hydrolysing)
MPGIFGVISRHLPQSSEQRVGAMLASMQYESFYNSGIYGDPDSSIRIGWTCHQKSFADLFPVINQAKNVILFMAGEVFNDVCQGAASDNENGPKSGSYLLDLYEDNGEKFVEKLNGWFCGLLLDTRRRKVFLFNDRYGMYRVFYHECKEGLYFSSEAKALLAVLPELRSLDPKGVGEFLTCGCTLGTHSLYKDMGILPTGALWVFEKGEVKKRGSYFDSKMWVEQQRLEEKQFLPLVKELFGPVVRRYVGGTLPVGISLTGGLDSRMIMACLSNYPAEIPCYTFGSMYRDTFDVKTGREVARASGQPHSIVVLGERFLADFPTYLEKAVYISDGYLGMSGAAELYVNSLARDIAPVRLTGNYGGELLRGHRAFKYEIPRGGFLNPELQSYLEEARTTFQALDAIDPVTFTLFKQAPSLGYGRLGIERSQVILRSPFMDNDLVKLVYQASPHLLKNEMLSSIIISTYNNNLLKIPTDRGLCVDGCRFGNMTRQLYRKALIKGEYTSGHGMPNWLAAISGYGFRRLLENSFIGRDKFQHFHIWTRKYFAGYVSDLTLAGGECLDRFFDRGRIEKMMRDHQAGRRNYTSEIDKIMTLTLGHMDLFHGMQGVCAGNEVFLNQFGISRQFSAQE